MRSLVALFALLLAACDSSPVSDEGPLSPGGLRLDADRPTYEGGNVVHLTLTNVSSSTYQMGACPRLERWDGTAWRDMTSDRGCPAILLGIEPGGRWDVQASLAGLPDGSYRAAHDLVREGASRSVTVATGAFRVE